VARQRICLYGTKHKVPPHLHCVQTPRDDERVEMKLQINGEQREVPDGLTLVALVEHLGMKADRVAVELNLEIVPRPNWSNVQLREGDKLEIVHFVGGG
jgi:sulfur carrier protein